MGVSDDEGARVVGNVAVMIAGAGEGIGSLRTSKLQLVPHKVSRMKTTVDNRLDATGWERELLLCRDGINLYARILKDQFCCAWIQALI